MVIKIDAMKTTNKSTKKTNSYNGLVLDRLQEKHGYSKVYIRQCLDGTRKPGIADTLIKEYKQMEQAVKAALK